MKLFYYILGVVFLPLILSAQPNIQNAEDFPIGTILKFQTCSTQNILAGNTGENITWDFTSLSPQPDTAIEWMISPSSAPNGAMFPSSNLVEKYSDGSYVYVYKTESANYLLGYVDSAQGLYINYPDSILFAIRPLGYGDAYTNNYTSNYSASGYDFSGTGVAKITADGYGELRLPNGTYQNVLRVKIIETQVDTLLQYNSLSTTKTVSYVWFDGVHASALLKLDSTKSASYSSVSIEYLLSEATLDVRDESALDITCYPNPANSYITINTNDFGQLYIMDGIGRTVLSENINANNTQIDLSKLEQGVYYAKFQGKIKNAFTKIVIIR